MTPRILLSFAITIFFAAATARAQERVRPVEFAGVPWGASVGEAIRVLQTRGGVKVAQPPSGIPKVVTATGGKFGNWEVERWKLEFVEGKLAGASVELRTPRDGTKLYREVQQQLTAKYGAASGMNVAANSASLQPMGNSQWNFPPTAEDKSQLSIALENGRDLTLRYTNQTLSAAGLLGGKRGSPGAAKDL